MRLRDRVALLAVIGLLLLFFSFAPVRAHSISFVVRSRLANIAKIYPVKVFKNISVFDASPSHYEHFLVENLILEIFHRERVVKDAQHPVVSVADGVSGNNFLGEGRWKSERVYIGPERYERDVLVNSDGFGWSLADIGVLISGSQSWNRQAYIPSSFAVCNSNPRLFVNFKCVGVVLQGLTRSVSRFFVSAVHESSEDRVGEQKGKPKQFRPKLHFVAPVLLSLAGYLISVWGWWNLYWRNTCGWRELGCGIAFIGGFWISVIGGFLLIRIF